jgi:glycerol-3-phosphate dehydrogenase
MKAAWTKTAVLPGGDLPALHLAAFIADLQKEFPWLPNDLLERYATMYGTRVYHLLAGKQALADLGEMLACGVYASEYEYLVRYEFVKQEDDVKRRLGLFGLV